MHTKASCGPLLSCAYKRILWTIAQLLCLEGRAYKGILWTIAQLLYGRFGFVGGPRNPWEKLSRAIRPVRGRTFPVGDHLAYTTAGQGSPRCGERPFRDMQEKRCPRQSVGICKAQFLTPKMHGKSAAAGGAAGTSGSVGKNCKRVRPAAPWILAPLICISKT